ncbi:MAG: hypothetical protein ACK5NC_13740 [Vibrio sp.]
MKKLAALLLALSLSTPVLVQASDSGPIAEIQVFGENWTPSYTTDKENEQEIYSYLVSKEQLDNYAKLINQQLINSKGKQSHIDLMFNQIIIGYDIHVEDGKYLTTIHYPKGVSLNKNESNVMSMFNKDLETKLRALAKVSYQ